MTRSKPEITSIRASATAFCSLGYVTVAEMGGGRNSSIWPLSIHSWDVTNPLNHPRNAEMYRACSSAARDKLAALLAV